MSRIFVLECFLTVVNLATVFGTDAELKLVNVVFRHGDRTPEIVETYPNDPYQDKTYFPVGRGGLTNAGKQREYHLGEVLRSLYSDFLGPVYYPAILKARSTDFDRTKMSLWLVLAALFPPAPIQQWSETLLLQPIPTEYQEYDKDYLLWPEQCPQYVNEYEKVHNSPEVLAKIAEFDDLMTSLSYYTGLNITDPYTFYTLSCTFAGQTAANLKLPDWVSEFYPDGELVDGTNLYYEMQSYNDVLKRLNGGMLLSKILSDASSLVNGTLEEGRKLFLYSGHEKTVGRLQAALRVSEPHVPPYSSAVIIELWQHDEEHYFKVLHHTGVPSEVITQKIPGCSELCPMDKFVELLKPVTATQTDLQCK